MQRPAIRCFWLFVLLCSASACVEHYENIPPAPSRFRIKVIQNTTLGQTTTYTYDGQNRPASFVQSGGGRGSYVYHSGKLPYAELTYMPGDTQQQATLTRFPYPLTSRDTFSVTTYNLQNPSSILAITNYVLDGSRHLQNTTTQQSGVTINGQYVYQGENIQTSSQVLTRARVRLTYQYDTNPNPFSDLTVVGPLLDKFDPGYQQYLAFGGIDEALRFSSNNITRTDNTDTGDTVQYTYSYNARNLPVSLVRTMNNETTTFQFTYEAY